MKTVALVSCSLKKVRTAEGGTLPARELYSTSDFFRAQLAEAESRCPLVYVVSAEHGLVKLEQSLSWYDKTMAEVEDKAAWGRGVVFALEALHPDEPLRLLVFAGSEYVEPIRQNMPAGWTLEDPLAGMTLLERRHQLGVWRNARSGVAGWLVVPALAIAQPGGSVYAFGVDGKRVSEFAAVSRIRRQEGALTGYQRVEAYGHIRVIKEYLESGAALVPNAVVIAFDSRVRFEPSEAGGPVASGHLHIPLGTGEDWKPPGWIVDGQQRLAAVREASVESFPLTVCAFIGDEQVQAEHFIRVNSTKPLPKQLIYTLLPHTGTRLSPALEARKLPALLVERLNGAEGSPLRGLIQTATSPSGVAKDTSFLNALENSLSDGALYRLQDDVDRMEALLFAWWGAVRDTFPEDWGKKPKESRLLHGAGVAALSLLMDAVAEEMPRRPTPTRSNFARELGRVAPLCRWSSGQWAYGPAWNEVEVTAQAKHKLATYLVRRYLERAKRPRRRRG